ncbi:hypothetical protein PMAYCL1PPCAC_31859, partial [Pristionchus mayeri]
SPMPPKTKVDAKKAEADRLQGLVLALLKEEENKYCADCDGKQPRWASWNLGVFICIRCAGIHRNLGVHVSKVKSVNLDSWTAEQCQSMRVMGNAKAKAVYEAELPEHFRRPQTDQQLESFIRAKYEHKRYILRDWTAPRVDVNEIPAAGEEHRSAHSAAVSASRTPVGARSFVNNNKAPAAPELLDMSFASSPAPAAAAAAAPVAPVPSLLDFDFAAPVAPTIAASPPAATNGDIDDIFGSFVSASPTPALSGATPAPPDPQPSAAAEGLSQITGELSGLTMGAASLADEKKSNSDIMALFGNMPKAAPAPQPVQQPQHNWGGGLFGGAAAAPQQPQQQQFPQMQQQQQPQMNMGMQGMNFNASFGMQPTHQPVQQKLSGGMGDLSGLMMGGNSFASHAPVPQMQPMQQVPQVQPTQPAMPQTTAFDSLSLNSLFPGGLTQASFSNPQTAAAFAAASPFASSPSMMGAGGGLNLDSLL